MRRGSLAAAVLALVLVACGGGDGGSRARVMPLSAAEKSCATLRPLLVVIVPGGRGDPEDRLGLRAAARRAGIATLYPEKEGTFWSLNDAQGRADVAAVSSLLDSTLERGCVDQSRIAITGVSNGAGFAVRLACEQAERFAAVAAVATGLKALDPCPPQARESFLEIHGGADQVVPYRGVPPDRKGSVPRFAAAWAGRAGCDAAPRVGRPRARVTHTRWTGCDGTRRVETILLAGTDHGWPGAGPPLPRHNPSGFAATPAVIDFVRRPRR
jgi:polyhydroxybutyrate depolymerase